MNNTSNLSTYLNKNNSSLLNLLNISINNNKCINCGDEIIHNRFERNLFTTYNFCKKCDISKIVKQYKNVECIICGKKVFKKDIVYSTCGSDNCIKKHKQTTYNNIKETHWTHSDNRENIILKRVSTRIKNDKKYNRKYVAWNKGKTGIYSKETIEK